MTNKARGFAPLQLGEETIDVCLGLGVLAELEDAFGVESFEQVPLFSGGRMSAKKTVLFIETLLKGNDIEFTAERRVAISRFLPDDFTALIGALATASGMTQSGAVEPGQDGAAPLVDAPAGEHG